MVAYKLLLGLALMILVSGCTAQTDDGVGAPTDTTQTTTGNETLETPQEEPDTPIETPTEPVVTPEPEEPIVAPPVITEITVDKLEAPYTCADPILLDNFREVFGTNTEILRKPAPYGKTINYSACNVKVSGTVLLQVEFHEKITLEAALESLEDEARQIESQLFESVKKTETIGNKGYSFSSERTGEYRFVFVDDDPANPVFVLVRSLPGLEIEEAIVRQGAETLEKII